MFISIFISLKEKHLREVEFVDCKRVIVIVIVRVNLSSDLLMRGGSCFKGICLLIILFIQLYMCEMFKCILRSDFCCNCKISAQVETSSLLKP